MFASWFAASTGSHLSIRKVPLILTGGKIVKLSSILQVTCQDSWDLLWGYREGA